MRLLFVHQNFPSQYIHVIRQLAQMGGHTLVGMGVNGAEMALPKGVMHVQYGLERGNTEAIHPFAVETESKVIRGEACARAAHQLREQGFMPDLICAHPGWGEALFLKEIWPQVPILCYQEFYYRTEGFDCAFDPAVQPTRTWEERARIQMKNANLLLSLQNSTWNVTPTQFQRSSFPDNWQSRISVIHDGIDTTRAQPATKPFTVKLPDGTSLTSGMPVVTFVNRRFEPYRGCHTMLRALPRLQELHPECHVVVVGNTQGVSYGAPCPDGEWREHFLKEIEGQYDPSRVHFTGTVNHNQFLSLLRLSAAHVYLTYPFVLSWSLLEAMSSGCAVVGSATAPVQEVITHGVNGLLVDFFKPDDLAEAIHELLSNRALASSLGTKARQTVLDHYELSSCVLRQLNLINLVASGAIG